MTASIDLTRVVPGTADARDRGCICPGHPDSRAPSGVMFARCGYMFSADCPVHRRAVRLEVQRLFGRPQ